MDDALPVVGPITGAWVDFFIMVGVFALIAISSLIWVFYFRKTRRRHRRKHRHHREHRVANPTLAETGGLPPARPPEPPDATPSETP
jgi:Na+/melibiose symporter-like transporter